MIATGNRWTLEVAAVPEAERLSMQANMDMALTTPLSRPLVLKPARQRECVIREMPITVGPADVPLRALPAEDPLVPEFVRAALAPDDRIIRELVDRLLVQGTSVQSIYLDLLAPTARALGDMWSDDGCDFVEVTVAVGRLQLVLRDLSQMFVRDRPEAEVSGRVLLACVPGEQHSLGLFMVAEFFVRDGWEVHVGPPLSDEQLLADVRTEWYDVVGFSVSCDSRLDHL